MKMEMILNMVTASQGWLRTLLSLMRDMRRCDENNRWTMGIRPAPGCKSASRPHRRNYRSIFDELSGSFHSISLHNELIKQRDPLLSSKFTRRNQQHCLTWLCSVLPTGPPIYCYLQLFSRLPFLQHATDSYFTHTTAKKIRTSSACNKK
jgi:hypothetical protein